MNKPTVSIIIPVYNIEKWIEPGLSSIQRQTFRDFEIILVDDGSTDSSSKLCDDAAKEYDNISVIHTENFGVGHARNVGIDNAKGEFIYFFDLDDQAESNLLEICLSNITKYNADLIVFSFDMIKVGGYVSTVQNRFYYKYIDNIQDLKSYYLNNVLLLKSGNGFIWNKFYRKDFILKHKICFPHLQIQQDEVFNLKVYRNEPKIVTLSSSLYNYYVYDSGNIRSRYIPNRFKIYLEVVKSFHDLNEEWGISSSEISAHLANRLVDSAVTTLRFNLLHPKCNLTKAEKEKEMTDIISNPLMVQSLNYCNLNITRRLIIFSAKRHSLRLLKMSDFALRFMSNTRRWIRKNLKI